MIGLSTTAIGLRPFAECLDIYIYIYEKLTPELGLEFLELAVGTKIECHQVPKIPVVLHDRCLYENNRRLPIDFTKPATWEIWKDFITWNGRVQAFTIHSPLVNELKMGDLLVQRARMEDYFGVAVYLELMPDDNWWTGPDNIWQLLLLTKEKILLADISHINLWHSGNSALVANTLADLAPWTGALHLSHNNGVRDEHSLIPEDIWFNPYVQEWAHEYLVTYESLPEKYAEYERLDKKRRRLKPSQSI